ncbi:unnamed protein product [Dovyalis caffra]|uniref:Uncharacterized protein n=1 Tax=Dovyalis caffra TaxID=77055 RepID=A0AAV1SNS5_9ROSI|nr:unnamed protein product [Dovyalis caffra]
MAISTWAQPLSPVLDVEGKPLRSGVEYYILPAETDIAGGLTSICNGSFPFYVGQEPLAPNVSQGTPVIFRPRFADTIIRESRDFTIAFSGATTCADSSAWEVVENPETRKRYIATGGKFRQPRPRVWYFNIVKNEQDLYTLAWCQNCTIRFPGADCRPSSRCVSAGIVKENGKRLLVLDDPAFPFVFRRAKVILPASTKNN